VTTGREEVGSEASTRARRAAAAALATAAFLLGTAVAMADPAPPPPPPVPPSGGGGSTSPSGPTTSSDSTPPKRARNLKVAAPNPGQLVLTWTLIHPSDIAHVFVRRGPAGHCPTSPVPFHTSSPHQAGKQIGSVDTRTRQVDPSEKDGKRYCYAVFTLDKAGNWDRPVTQLAQNEGDTKAPAAVTRLTGVFGAAGAVRLSWKNPRDATHDLVIRGRSSACPGTLADGDRIGTRALRESQIDSSVQSTGTYCYAVFAFDNAGNRSPIVTTTVKPTPATQSSDSTSPPSQSSSSGSSLSNTVGLVGGGAIVLAGLVYATLRILRREWEWHSRTGYGIRDLMSIDVRDYDRQALVIPAIIGVGIAGAVVVLLLSL
jgi:hypothetical protein